MESDILALVARSSLVMALGLLAALLLRRRSAALRHLLLVLAFAAAVVVGPVAAVVPTWRLPLPVPALSNLPDSTGGVTPVPAVASASPIAATNSARAAKGASISLAEALLGLCRGRSRTVLVQPAVLACLRASPSRGRTRM